MNLTEIYRSLNGSGNNKNHPDWGKAGTPFRRLIMPAYGPNGSPSGENRPNPRDISNIVLTQRKKTVTPKAASDHFWVWGQFLAHDIVLTPTDETDRFDVPIPKGDPYFDPSQTGTASLPLARSIFVDKNGRQQVNTQSSFIDASNVYGATEERAQALRSNNGTGRLKTGRLGLLPKNTEGLENAPNSDLDYLIAGDPRCNEQPLLTAYHAIWVREHNRLADELRHEHPSVGGDIIYQEARRRVIALNQIITYNEFLPILMGSNALRSYIGYSNAVDPNVINVFATASYRLGHSLVSSQLLRLQSDLTPIAEGPLALRDAFFNLSALTVGGGVEPLVRGAAYQTCEDLDARIIDDLRNFLFGSPGQGGADLAALNIQRGRDHGFPGYNVAREQLGLSRKPTFNAISSNQETVARLSKAYSSVDDIDIWVGGLAENSYRDSLLGELFFTICKIQFEALRDGDRFWYRRQFDKGELEVLEATTWSQVITRNLADISDELPSNVFIRPALPTENPHITELLKNGATIVP